MLRSIISCPCVAEYSDTNYSARTGAAGEPLRIVGLNLLSCRYSCCLLYFSHSTCLDEVLAPAETRWRGSRRSPGLLVIGLNRRHFAAH